MNTLLRIFTLFFVVFIALPSLTACGEIPLGEYRIEWDEYDPELHGQVVHFKKSMSYVLLEEKHIGDYIKEEFEIGRLLETEDSVFEPGGYAKSGHLSQQIKDGMAFTIKATYWYRRDWFERELVGDRRSLIMVDENEVESVMSFYEFYYSDRPELIELKDEGRFK